MTVKKKQWDTKGPPVVQQTQKTKVDAILKAAAKDLKDLAILNAKGTIWAKETPMPELWVPDVETHNSVVLHHSTGEPVTLMELAKTNAPKSGTNWVAYPNWVVQGAVWAQEVVNVMAQQHPTRISGDEVLATLRAAFYGLDSPVWTDWRTALCPATPACRRVGIHPSHLFTAIFGRRVEVVFAPWMREEPLFTLDSHDARMLDAERNSVASLVQHLNDSHKWTYDQIADWLETLDVDLTKKEN